jgi:hypothetical protein
VNQFKHLPGYALPGKPLGNPPRPSLQTLPQLAVARYPADAFGQRLGIIGFDQPNIFPRTQAFQDISRPRGYHGQARG